MKMLIVGRSASWQKKTGNVAYVLTLVVVVADVDVLFFGHHVWERLTANVGTVLVFSAFFLTCFKRP